MDKKIYIFLIILIILIVGGIFLYLNPPQKLNSQKPKSDEIVSPSPSIKPGDSTKSRDFIDLGQNFSYYETGSSYKVATTQTTGNFKSGQEADILLSGIDFNNADGPLLFNHPGNIASDGQRLILADRNNNRVLIWNTLPTQNKKPDLVLGQKDFIQNNPGAKLDQMNWPVGVATDRKRLLVADTYNDRILIWNTFPTQNGQTADYAISNPDNSRPMDENSKAIAWPWAVWTDGQKLIVTSTGNGRVFIWNTFPKDGRTLPDIVLHLRGKFGTPRSIGSDGKRLVIGDHNAYGTKQGNFFWKNFPTRNDQEPNFFISTFESASPPPPQTNQDNSKLQPRGIVMQPGDIFWGPVFTSDGKVIVLSGNSTIGIWDSFPENENDLPDLIVGQSGGPGQKLGGYSFAGGDGSSMALAGDKLYIALCNSNKIVGFNSIPTKPDQLPNFAIGAPDIYTNTLETEFIMSNPVPASNDKNLFVSSDFDRKLYVYKKLPDESGAKPDLVYNLPEGPWDNALFGETLVLAGKRAVYIWKSLPIEPKLPDVILENKIGNIELQEIKGVALDKKYFYLADTMAKKIYIWEGIPSEDSNPLFTLEADGVARLSSDGEYLVGAFTEVPGGGDVRIYKIDDLNNTSQPISLVNKLAGKMRFNLPQGATITEGKLIVGDTGFNRVEIWSNIKAAIDGKNPDIIWGWQENAQVSDKATPKIGKADLFWPAVASYDGNYIWLGEFKFSERLLRFSPK